LNYFKRLMMNKLSSVCAGIALLAGVSTANAGAPVTITDAQLDNVTAGSNSQIPIGAYGDSFGQSRAVDASGNGSVPVDPSAGVNEGTYLAPRQGDNASENLGWAAVVGPGLNGNPQP
jgi:hypothetical protein